MAAIRARGRLIVGVSADTYLLGARNPLTGQIEGFDIDLAKQVAKAILGNENAIQLVVITAADRIPALQQSRVDIVVRNMTMNCARWQDVAFSQVYYQSGQKLLVRRGSPIKSLDETSGVKCAHPRARRPTPTSRVSHRARWPSALTTTPAVSCSSSRVTWTRSPATTRCSPGSPRRTRMPW